MEHWEYWSIACVLIGMAGFWGGVLQHSHLNAGDGGTLTTYLRAASVNLTPATINSSVVNTILASLPMPATQILPTSRLIFEAWGDCIQNTGVAAAAPTFAIDLDGTNVCSIIGATVSLPNSPSAYGLYCRGEYQMRNSVASSIRDIFGIIEQNLTALPALADFKARAESGINFSAGVTINVRAQNAVNNALYTTRFWKLAVNIG